MIRTFCLSLLLVYAAAFAQVTAAEENENRLLETVQSLADKLPESNNEAAAAVWRLCQIASQTKDSQIHWRARIIAEKISAANPLNPRTRFVYGYFRAREAIETAEPITQKRRLHEGRRVLEDAIIMGSRDGHFLLDAGLLVLSLSKKIDMVQRGLDALAMSRRTLAAEFDALPATRRADWNAGMGKGLALLDVPEMARDYYEQAKLLAPESPSGEMAIAWLRARYGNG